MRVRGPGRARPVRRLRGELARGDRRGAGRRRLPARARGGRRRRADAGRALERGRRRHERRGALLPRDRRRRASRSTSPPPTSCPRPAFTEALVDAARARRARARARAGRAHRQARACGSPGARATTSCSTAASRSTSTGPTMLHAKTLVLDGIWSSVGSVNFDNRSFQLHDEATLCVQSRGLRRGAAPSSSSATSRSPSASARALDAARAGAARRRGGAAARPARALAGEGPAGRLLALATPVALGMFAAIRRRRVPRAAAGRDRPLSRAPARARSARARASSSASWTALVAAPLQQVVGDDPQVERALVRRVAADAPDEHVVAARGGGAPSGRRGGRVVDHRDAGRGLAAARAPPRPTSGSRVCDVDRLGVRGDHRDARARDGDRRSTRRRGSCASRTSSCAPRRCGRRRRGSCRRRRGR